MVLDLFSLKNELKGPVLVTGHTGFKGMWLTLLLEQLEIEVIGYSLAPIEGSLYERLERSGKISEKISDIRDYETVNDFIKKSRPAAVIHLAAQPLVLESYNSPRETFETNVMGTVNLLEAAMQSNEIKAFVSITTDKVYRNENKGVRFLEDAPLNGKDPYSASKVGSEAAIAAWQQISEITGGPKIIAARAGNVIGGGDWAKDRLIPDLIRGFSQEQTVQIRNPNSTRPWQHALDPLAGYLMVLQKALAGEKIKAINFGPVEDSMSVGKVSEIAKKIWGAGAELEINSKPDNNYEAIDLDLNSSMANNLLGWVPRWTQKEAVEVTVNWWKKLFDQSCSVEELCQYDLNYLLERK